MAESDVDLMRRAARSLRELAAEFVPAGRAERFYTAVAELVETHANDLASAAGALSACDSPGDVQQALRIARAHLGEPEPSATP